jgi:hypothetical protein
MYQHPAEYRSPNVPSVICQTETRIEETVQLFTAFKKYGPAIHQELPRLNFYDHS